MRENKLVIIFLILISAFGIVALAAPELIGSFIIVAVCSSAYLLVVRRYTDEASFITKLFVLALVLRLGFGLLVHFLDLREFFWRRREPL